MCLLSKERPQWAFGKKKKKIKNGSAGLKAEAKKNRQTANKNWEKTAQEKKTNNNNKKNEYNITSFASLKIRERRNGVNLVVLVYIYIGW